MGLKGRHEGPAAPFQWSGGGAECSQHCVPSTLCAATRLRSLQQARSDKPVTVLQQLGSVTDLAQCYSIWVP